MFLLLLWLAFGVFTSMAFQRKGKSAGLGLLVGLAFGIFGLIYALVMSPNIQGIEQHAVDEGTLKKCPQCAEMVKKDARICRFCQHAFNYADVSTIS